MPRENLPEEPGGHVSGGERRAAHSPAQRRAGDHPLALPHLFLPHDAESGGQQTGSHRGHRHGVPRPARRRSSSHRGLRPPRRSRLHRRIAALFARGACLGARAALQLEEFGDSEVGHVAAAGLLRRAIARRADVRRAAIAADVYRPERQPGGRGAGAADAGDPLDLLPERGAARDDHHDQLHVDSADHSGEKHGRIAGAIHPARAVFLSDHQSKSDWAFC